MPDNPLKGNEIQRICSENRSIPVWPDAYKIVWLPGGKKGVIGESSHRLSTIYVEKNSSQILKTYSRIGIVAPLHTPVHTLLGTSGNCNL